MADFNVAGGGTVYLLIPNSEAAKAWCDEHLPEDAPRLGQNYAVGHHYIGNIVQGIVADGLSVE